MSVPTSDSAACTGCRSVTTPMAPMTITAARMTKAIISVIHAFQLGPRPCFEAEAHVAALGGGLPPLPLAALHAHQHVLLAVHEVLVAEVGQLELVPEDHRAGGAGFLAEAAEDAAKHVDLVDLGVAF